jgi:hypothetical protein
MTTHTLAVSAARNLAMHIQPDRVQVSGPPMMKH